MEYHRDEFGNLWGRRLSPNITVPIATRAGGEVTVTVVPIPSNSAEGNLLHN